MTESEVLDYNEAITDFAMMIQNYGPYNVAMDLDKYYPGVIDLFLRASVEVRNGKKIAALFKPPAR